MAKSTQFQDQMQAMSDSLSQLFVRSIKTAMIRGLDVAVEETKQDSSNAAAHWMIAGTDSSTSRPWSRKLGKIQDMRGTSTRAPLYPVGYRRDQRGSSPETVKFVHQRELAEVLNKLVAGRSPEFKFYFYNAVGDNPEYAGNANLEAAGTAAAARVVEEANKLITAGNTRKVTLT